ncbi:MAG TPA: heavy metal-binding domain-containing protein [Acidimicrobiales bacterium]|nr:heavy metal-binding domain-containing protein [Acidimicrobiales bacterium]
MPPTASQRLSLAKESDLRASLLTAKGWAALESAGVDPIGAVVGCRGERIDWGEYGLGEVRCGYVSRALQRNPWSMTAESGRREGRITSSAVSMPNVMPSQALIPAIGSPVITSGPAVPPISAVTGGSPFGEAEPGGEQWRPQPLTYTHAALVPTKSAIDRMLLEAIELGADGVVGADVQHVEVGKGIWECTVTGTAVRVSGAAHARRPFVTTLGGADVAKLLGAGYVPATVVVAMTVGIVHDLLRAQAARNRFSSFREINHITALVQASRLHNRRQIDKGVADVGASGAILTGKMTVELEEHRVSTNHQDVVCQVSSVAATIVEFGDGGPDFAADRPRIVLGLLP